VRAGHRIAPIAVGIATLAAFLPSLRCGFVHWDDLQNFVENTAFRGLGAENLRWMFTQFHLGHWQPLSWITLALDFLVWDMKPAGWHFTNALLHALGAGVFARVAAVLFEEVGRGREGAARAAPWFGAAVALLWSLHPLRVEAVTWITQRREVLCGALTLLAAACHLRGRSRWLTYALAVAAMLAKVTAVMLPVALILIDAWRDAALGGALLRAALRAARRHAVLLAAAAGVVAAALLAQRTAGALVSLQTLPPASRVAIYLYDLAFAVEKTLVPAGLAPLHQAHDPATWALDARVWALAAVALVLVAGAFAWAIRRRSSGAIVLVALFLLLSAPAGGFTQSGPQIAADRYTYQSGWVLSLGAGLLAAGAASPRARVAWAWLAAALCAVLLALSIRQQRFWIDTETLWRRELDVYPGNALANYYLGIHYVKHRPAERAKAEPLLRAAIEASPAFGEARLALAFVLQRSGRMEDAWALYQDVLRLQPDDPGVIALGGGLAWDRGDRAAALEAFERLTRIRPKNPDSWRQLARAQAAAGRPRDALATFDRGIAEVSHPILWGDLAWLLATHPDAAIRDGRRALPLAERALLSEGRTIRATNIMAAACAEAGEFDRGLREVEAASAVLPPEQAPALARLRDLLTRREPIRVEPAFP
jgi:tetratricopeptide (TPR) repeat protein